MIRKRADGFSTLGGPHRLAADSRNHLFLIDARTQNERATHRRHHTVSVRLSVGHSIFTAATDARTRSISGREDVRLIVRWPARPDGRLLVDAFSVSCGKRGDRDNVCTFGSNRTGVVHFDRPWPTLGCFALQRFRPDPLLYGPQLLLTSLECLLSSIQSLDRERPPELSLRPSARRSP